MTATIPLTNNTISYRADIEGLRALAVLMVIFAHANFSWIGGGFIGVDVFFVISGYLITGILHKEITSSGAISLSGFYARRFRRLLPALLAMIIGTSLIATQIIPLTIQPEQAAAAATAVLWASNLYFTFTQFDYFGTTASDNLFLHTWSLGVEEQFYLIWPALLLALFHLVIKKNNRLNILIISLLIISLLSFVASVLATGSAPNWAYYMMPMRIWQFGAGAIAFFVAPYLLQSLKQPTRNLGQLLGLIIIVASALLLNKHLSYPGWYAIAPTLGAFLVLACISEYHTLTSASLAQGIAQKILTTKPMLAMGRVSYSWYLWHWPVLILGNLYFIEPNAITSLLLIGLSWVMALISYYCIETPIRKNKIAPQKNGWQIIAAISLMVLIGVQLIHWHNNAKDKLHLEQNNPYIAAQMDLPVIYSMGCDDWYHSPELKPCEFGNPNADKTAVIIADSVGAQWFPALAKLYANHDWRLVVLTKSACPIADEPIFYPRINREYTECAEWRSKLPSLLATLNPKILFIGSTESYEFTNAQWQTGTEKILSKISTNAEKVFVIRATPTLPFNGIQCLYQQYEKTQLSDNCSAPYNPSLSTVWPAIMHAAQKFPNVYPLDLNPMVCPKNICNAQIGSIITYRDAMHLTATFTESLSDSLKNKLNSY